MLNSSLSMVPEDVFPSAWVGHLPFSFWLIEEVRPDVLVELGTHNGTSFLSFCQAIKQRGTRTKAYAVDTWQGDEHAGHYGDEVYGRLDSLVKAKYAGFAQLMRMLFDEAMPYFSDGSIDLLHIDGLHTYEAVKHDFETWLPKLSRRGVVIFHDTMVRERGFGVWRLWEELRERYPSFEFKHTHGLGVLLVGDQPPEAVKALCSLTGTPHEAVTSSVFDALGQRFSLLEKISQLDARSADAVQHAANYRGMYESSDASLRHAMDSFGVLLEERHKELQAASAQIATSSASFESLAAGFRSQVASARRELDLPAWPADTGALDHALDGLVQDIKARNVEHEARHATVEEAQLRLAQALAASESQLGSAQLRMDDLQHRHASELAALSLRSDAEQSAARAAFDREREAMSQALQASAEGMEATRRQNDQLAALHHSEVSAAGARFDAAQSAARAAFDLEREVLSQALQASAAGMEATRQQMDQLRALHDSEMSAAGALFGAEQSATRLAFDRELGAMSRARRASEASLAAARKKMDKLCFRHAGELAAVRAGVEADLLLAGARRQADVSELKAQICQRDAIAQDLRLRLTRRENEVLRLVGSKSWRTTAPIRWLRGRWAAFGNGTRAPTYAEVLEAPDEAATQSHGGGESAPWAHNAFDPQWYLAQYPDVAMANIGPYDHYLARGRIEGRLPRAPEGPLSAPGQAAQGSWFTGQTKKDALPLPEEVLDADFYLQSPDTAIAGVGSDEHFSTEAALDAPAVLEEAFDPCFYLLQYPDVASAGIDPYEHYLSNGRAEGRHALRPSLVISEGGIAFDPARETVLVLAHEASRTGAPVLSLNLVTTLTRRYNVIAMLLGDGALTEDFRSRCTWLVGPMELRNSSLRASVIIDLLMELHRPKFAIVNSVESRVVLEPLARHGVVTVSLVHEFAVYTRPRNEFRSALLWADETVFSTPLTRESAHIEFPEFAGRAFTVLPQGRCHLPAGEQDQGEGRREDSRLMAALRPRGKADDDFVILGAGFVQQRKGVDLFIQCAGHVMSSERGRNCRFVWIGSGYDPERDLGYSVYLADQLRRSGLDKVVQIIDETLRIETAYQAADLLLLSSRLDPLPNVAIDAMAHGLPVVCFDKSSGIAGVLVEEGLREHLVAGYLDVHDMASKVLDLASSPILRQQIRERVLDVVDRCFSMETYVDALEKLALDADARLARRALEADEIVQSGLFRADFHASRKGPNAPVESVVEFEYLRCWDHGIDCRKPFPGFHPGVYRSTRGLARPGDPLADFLRAGSSSGPWLIDVISPQDQAPPRGANGRIALHLHVYYPCMLPGILARLTQNLMRPDLYISIPDEAVKARIEPMLADYPGRVAQVQVVPNRGRDIGPFLTAFADEWSAYDVVGHLHTKKSVELNDPALSLRWSEFLMENLLGGGHRMADTIVDRLLADPGLGLVFPDDPHVMGWSGNRAHAEELGRRLGVTDLPDEFNFPVGTMFWARPAAIASLIDLRLQWDDYPVEPLGYDGTILHAIERLVPLVAVSSGFRYAVTNVPGVTR